MCVIVPCRAQFSAKLFVRVSYEDTPPEVRSRPQPVLQIAAQLRVQPSHFCFRRFRHK